MRPWSFSVTSKWAQCASKKWVLGTTDHCLENMPKLSLIKLNPASSLLGLMLNRALQKKEAEERGGEATKKKLVLTLKKGKWAPISSRAMRSTKPLRDVARKTTPKSKRRLKKHVRERKKKQMAWERQKKGNCTSTNHVELVRNKIWRACAHVSSRMRWEAF